MTNLCVYCSIHVLIVPVLIKDDGVSDNSKFMTLLVMMIAFLVTVYFQVLFAGDLNTLQSGQR